MTTNTVQAAEPIPGYVLKERLGAGGYGEVWQAEAPGGLLKAIKFVYGYHDEDRAARELKALNRIKQVRHPFLLSLERIEIIEGQLLIVTELADASLKDVFTQRRGEGLPGIPRDELLQYMRDTADALDYMNEQFSLQHLDIKPENLLLVGGRIKVGDFGLVKDIHDHTMSLMGGLTPIYAPPEVFDGRPSRRSDQYSLAIVFQQMLTGELPFSGRTAAQLASQHLHAKPRLAGLSPGDQEVLQRALAKDASERFVSCREMVERLCGRNSGGMARGGADDGDQSSNAGSRSVAPVRKTLGRTELMDGDEAEQASLSAVSRSVSRRETFQPSLAEMEGDTYVPRVPAKPKIVALPPMEGEEFRPRLRPTLFVGVGGTAALVLRGLRERVAERFGGLAEVPAFRMLLLDTDAQTVRDAEYANSFAAFDPSETLSIPLRRPQDYRNKSADHLKWLSRRWLYNIPRSLKTEGLRPLGRLAMADHAATILQRLESALAAAAAPEAIAAAGERLGAPLESDRPRIVIVSSIAGATGGGASLDIAYLARQALANLGLESNEVDAILTLSTPRSAQGKDLALANAFAFLREWRHYHRRGYPGDRACGLPPFDATPPFHAAYLVHLGGDLGDDEFRTAAESAANYLFLDSFTRAGDFFLRCREASPAPGEGSPDPTLRTFGVSPIGVASRDHIASLVETLCRGVLDRWRGLAEQSRAARLAGTSATSQREDPSEPPLDLMAVERAGGLRIDLDEWLRRVQQIVEALLQSDPDVFFSGLINDALPHDKENEAELPALAAAALRTINGVLGYRDGEGDYHEGPELNVVSMLEERIDLLAGRQAMAVQRCVWEKLDAPKRMVKSAQHALQGYLELLREIDQKARTSRQEMEPGLGLFQQRIHEYRPPEPGRRSQRPAGQPAPHQAVRHMLAEYARQRLASVCLQAACRLAQTVIRKLTLAGDELKDLARGLDKAAGQFSLYFEDGPAGASTVVATLRSRTPELISVLDEQFRSSYFPAGEGFRAALRKDLQLMERLPDSLRDAARRIASEAVRSIELAGVLFPEGEDPLKTHERLAELVQTAQPSLIYAGGATRALLVLPENGRDDRLQSLFTARFGQAPTVVFDAHCDAALCCEMEQLPVASLAAMLIDHRRDLAEAASRLQARSDVNWSAWPRHSETPSR